MARYFVLGVKILCVGLLIHFLVHTLMTYGIGREMGALWAWKELVIAVLFMIFLYVLIFHNQWKILFSTHRLFFLIVGVLALGVICTLLIHLVRIDAPITRRAMAMRYDYL